MNDSRGDWTFMAHDHNIVFIRPKTSSDHMVLLCSSKEYRNIYAVKGPNTITTTSSYQIYKQQGFFELKTRFIILFTSMNSENHICKMQQHQIYILFYRQFSSHAVIYITIKFRKFQVTNVLLNILHLHQLVQGIWMRSDMCCRSVSNVNLRDIE